MNCEAERILQKTKQEMVGRNLWELFPEAVGSRFQIEYQRCLAENQTVHFDEFYPPFKRWFAVHAYPSDIGLSVYFNDITTHKHTEETLSFLAQCGRTNSGEDFFQLLARYLAQRLSMDFVCIDQLQEGSLAVQTVAVYFDGKYEDNQSYTLKDTPCGEVVGKTICCFPQDVRHRFPKDAVLQEMRAESYVGVTLWSSQGQAIGLIAVIGRQPLADAQPAKAMLQLVAVRAAAELERRQADEALRASEERLQLAQQAGRIGAFDRNLRTDETFWTKELEEIYGLPSGGFQGSFAKWQESIHPDDRPAVDEMIRQSIADHSSFQMEFRILWPDGSLHWIAAWGRVICDKQGQPIRSVGVNMEISDRKRAEEVIRKLNAELEQRVADRTCELRRANQMLHMVSKCDEALVRISSERDLIQEVCRIINEVGGYRMVWVGFAEQDKRRTVRVVASAGFDVGCLDTIPITWADNKFGRDPTGTAIRTGRICQGEDFLSDGRLAAWHKIAREHVFRSSIALPLVAGGQAFGALTIFAVQPHAFDPAQVRLLSELVDDLSFGITALRVHADRDHARRELEQRTAQLRSLAAELAQTEQRERRRIAQVLHDQLQQLLVGARYQLDGMQVGSSSADFAQARQQVDNLLSQCLETSRSLTLELSPPILDQAGLIAALKWLGRWFRETHGLAVRVIADDQVRPEREEIRVTLFQAVRELLFNVVKHARVQQARVRVSRLPENQIKIVVSDRGTGFDPKRLRMKEGAGAGIGLFSLRERLDWLGGRMEIDSAAGRGSRFTLWVPLKRRRKIPSTLVHNDSCAF